MRNFLLGLLIFLLAALAFIVYQFGKSQKTAAKIGEVKIGDSVFNVEIADTIASRAKGLSGHAPLAADQGMFFIFQIPGPYPFWMKDMNFPLDIVWIRSGQVTGFAENVPVPSGANVPTVSPPGAIDRVLEINAGLVKRDNIKVGDAVMLNLQ